MVFEEGLSMKKIQIKRLSGIKYETTYKKKQVVKIKLSSQIQVDLLL